MAKILLTIQADNKATESVKALNAEVRVLSQTLSSIKVNKNLTAQINALTKHYTALAKAQAKIIANNNKQAISDEKVKQQQAKTAQQVANAAAAQARLEKAQGKTSATTEQLQRKFANLLSTIKSIKNAYPEGTFEKIEQSVRANLQAAKDGSKSVDELGNAYSTLSKDVAVAKAETDKVTTAVVKSGDSIASLAKKFLLWQVTATLVMQPIRLLQNALTSINETLVKTEDAVIALQRVLPTGSATNDEISSRLYKVAQDYGQTFENVSQIATNFARTGMSWADTIKATEAAVLALNVAELDATEASEGLISILTQFGMTADQLTEIVDKLNKAADRNPVTTEKLLTALQRTGAAAKNANITLDETIGIITTLSKATNRSGENLGTAVNSLIQFSSKESSLNTFAKFGGDVETAVEKFRAGAGSILEIWEELGEVIQDRQGEAESILGGGLFNNEEWAALNDELKEALGESYADVTDIYNTASVFRRNYFVALLNDMDNVKKVTGEIADAAGYSQSENEKYLNTYTAKLNSLKAQWQDLANDEQGILGFKKNLVDIGGGILTVINYTGKLNTVFLLAGAAINKLIGAKVADSIATQITSWSRLSRIVHAEAIPSIIDYSTEIKRLKIEILTAVDSEMLLAKQTELLALKQQRLASIFKNVSSAIGTALLVFSAINAIQGAIDQTEEDRVEKEQEELRKIHEKISASLEAVEANKSLAQSTSDYAATVEELRKTLESSTSAESEKQAAQAQLLSIQNNLIDSNASYAGSLDLINGKLAEQLGLVEKMSEEQLRQQAKDFMDENFGQKDDVEKLVGQGSTSVELLNGSAFNNDKNKKLVKELIAKAQEQGIELGLDNYVNAPTWFNPIVSAEEAIRDAANGKGFDLWKFLGFNYKAEQWTGESSTGVTLEGTLEERIESLKNFRQLIIDNYSDWGWAETDAEAYVDRLDAAFAELNSEENQNAIAWAKKEQAAEDFYNHVIDEETFLERFYGITKKTADKTEDWHNNIAKVKDEYDDLIKALEKLRDAEKESLELEERKQAVLEAQKALENARNEATVRRYNEATGQWEWQTDEKAIAEAEKSLEKARDELEKQAYKTIIDQLENNTATNEGLNNLLDGLVSFLGDDFITAIKAAILGSTNVDLNKPVNETSNAESNPQENASSTTSKKPEAQDIHVLKNSDGSYATGKGIDKENIGDNGSVEWNGKKYRIENGGEVTDSELIALVKELGFPDRTIFTYKGSIYGVLDGGIVRLQARANSYGDKSKSGYKALSDAATSEFGSYDSGGIASGMGYMPKATDRPETVNNPDLTAKILSPVSNEQFHQYVRDMGILFETARQYAQSPVIERAGGNTDNSVNNSGQVIMNGVSIGADKRGASLDEILALGGIIPNV